MLQIVARVVVREEVKQAKKSFLMRKERRAFRLTSVI